VLEHIPDWRTALQEIARVGRRALITVPDMSAIPAPLPSRVVPWHLLESTHLNFFTQRSLHLALSPFFSRVRFLRLGEFWVTGLASSPAWWRTVSVTPLFRPIWRACGGRQRPQTRPDLVPVS